MGIRPLQLDVTEGVSNNSTVPTLGKVEDLIGVENLWDRVTGSPNYVKPHTDGDSVYAYYDAGGWFSIDPTATRIDLKVGSDITELHINSDTVDTDVNIWGTGSGSPVFFLDADANAIAINTTILSGFDVTVSGGVYFGGDIGATANRISKGWFTNLEITNYPSVNGTPLSNQYLATTDMPSFAQLTVDNIKLNGNTILVTNADGSLTIDCNGAGTVSMPRAGTFGAVTAATQIYVGNIDIIGDVITSSANVDLKSSLSTGNVRILDDSDVPVFCYCNSTDIFAFSDTVTISVGNDLKVNTINTYNSIAGVTVEGVELLNNDIKADSLTGLSDAILGITAYAGKGITLTGGDNADILITAGINGYVKMDNVRIYSSTVETTAGDLRLISASNNLVIGNSAAGVDYILSFAGQSNVGQIKWWEDEAYWTFDHPIIVNNVKIDTNTISSTSGNLNLTPIAGSDAIIDGHWGFDGTILTALTDANTSITAYAGKNITIEGVSFDGVTLTMTNNSDDYIINCVRGAGAGKDFIINAADAGFAGGSPENGGNIILNTGAEVSGGDDGEIYLQINDVTKAHLTADYLSISGYINQTGIFAEIYVADASAAQSIATGVGYTKSTAFTSNGQSSNATADSANDKITITQIGRYRTSGSFSGTSGKANLTWRGAAFLNGVEQDQVHWKRKMTTTTDSGSMSFTGFIDVTSVPWDLDFRLRHDDGGNQNFTIEYANLNVEYVGST